MKDMKSEQVDSDHSDQNPNCFNSEDIQVPFSPALGKIGISLFRIYHCFRVLHENMILRKKNWCNPLWKWRSFRECTRHIRFDHFYIVDFHSALTTQVSVQKNEGWVKIYIIKMVKTEMARGPPKLCRNQKPFWILSNYPSGWCVVGLTCFHSTPLWARF